MKQALLSTLAVFLRAAMLALLLAGFALLMFQLPKLQVPAGVVDVQKRFEIEDAARKTLAQIVGGGFFLLTGYFTWRSVRASEAGLRIAQEAARKADEKQIAERLVKATESLGSDKVAVRLGGAYSLGHIATDSPSNRAVVVEILCAYIRQACPLPDPATVLDGAGPAPGWGGKRPSPDVQAALTVLVRCGPWTKGVVLVDLKGTDLRGAVLEHADLERADLYGACLAGAMLDGAKLAHADLMNADLRQANFQRASLNQACLDGADLRSAWLVGASFDGAQLDETVLDEVVVDRHTSGLAAALKEVPHRVLPA